MGAKPRHRARNQDLHRDGQAGVLHGAGEIARVRAADILRQASQLVAVERERQHGPKFENHQNIAWLWNAFLAIRKEPGAPLSAADVALMMVLLKVARTQLGDHNADDFLDMAGYAGIAGEIAARGDE